jgi:hypothetical protein
MTFAVIYVENGDLVADFDSEDEALEALRGYVADSPSISDRVGLMAFDDYGRPASTFQPASSLVGYAQPA